MAPFDPEIDRKNMRLAGPAHAALKSDSRRIVIVGARGWIGRTTLCLMREALGPADFAARVACFGSANGDIVLDGGTVVAQRALSELPQLDSRPTLLFHFAFLTKDKVAGMDADSYERANRALSRTVLHSLDKIGADRVFVASSGAAAFADDPQAAADLRLYGRLKREDEESFAAWACQSPLRRAACGRIYSVSGPFINKLDTYALPSFILDGLAGRPIEVRAPMPVVRSYVPVRELVSFVLAQLLGSNDEAVLRFDTGGAPLELAEVARLVGQLFGVPVERRAITEAHENRYTGDEATWRALLAAAGMAPLELSAQIAETAAYLARAEKG